MKTLPEEDLMRVFEDGFNAGWEAAVLAGAPETEATLAAWEMGFAGGFEAGWEQAKEEFLNTMSKTATSVVNSKKEREERR
jgi:hypothetical protein